MSLLQRQAAAIRKEHTIPDRPTPARAAAPSLLFSPEEAKKHDQDAFAALALQGLAEASTLEPELAAFAPLFEGAPRDRGTLTREENGRLDTEIHRMLLLLSPHLMTRGAQECVDGLLARHHIHRWNVDDVMACALPYHDSPLFTRLLQGLHVEGKPRWSWLQTLKAKPATLVRSALAKYCAKDLSVLQFIGDVVLETAKMQKTNRPLATFFATCWLDTLTAAKSVGPDLVNVGLPTVQTLLRSPHLGDSFHAALVVLGALCIRVDLGPAAQTQLVERVARQLSGEHGRSAATSLAFLLQSQATVGVSPKALQSLSNVKPKALSRLMPVGMDCSNLAAVLLQSCLSHAALRAEGDESQRLQEMAHALLQESMYATCQAPALASAVLQAFCECAKGRGAGDEKLEQVIETFRKPVSELSTKQPVALGAAFRKAADMAVESGAGTEALVRLVQPAGDAVEGESDDALVPLVQAFAHSSAKTRAAAVQTAVGQLQEAADGEAEDAPRQRLLASLVLQAAQDESPDVVEKVLLQEAVWSSLPQVEPVAAFGVLDSLLLKMFGGARARGASPREVASALLTQDAQTCRLAAPLLKCLAWVYGRDDCPKDLRARIDATLLPVLLLLLSALDASQQSLLQASAADSKKLTKLHAAVLGYCRASKHKLLAHFKGKSAHEWGTFVEALGGSADQAQVAGLCAVVETGLWPCEAPGGEGLPRAQALGGAASQCAAATLLAGFLPQLAASAAPEEVQRMVVRCADACERLAWHHALTSLGEGEAAAGDHLRELLLSTIKATGAVLASAGEEKRRRRKSKGTKEGPQSNLLCAVTGLLRVALERPRSFSAALKQALGLPIGLLRPALFSLALGPEPHSAAKPASPLWSAAVANALLTLRSLASSEEWVLDQSALVPLVARLASAKAKEVRAAAFQVLEMQAGAEASGWDSPCAAALAEAGVLRSTEDVLPSGAWAAAQEQQIELAGMGKKALGTFLKQLAASKTEVLQDCSAVAPALAKFLASQKAASKATAFWAVGLSMLQTSVAAEVPDLMGAVPAAGLVADLAAPLKAAAEEMLDQLKSGVTEIKAPALLGAAASAVAAMAAKPDAAAAEAEAASSFVKSVALPFCAGLAGQLEGAKGQRMPAGMAELVGAVCQSAACTVAQPAGKALKSEAVATLFRLGVAVSTPQEVEDAEEEEEEAREAAGAATLSGVTGAALLESKLDAKLLSKILAESPSLREKKLGTPAGCAAADLLCQQVVGLPAGSDGAPELLAAVGKAAQTAPLAKAEAEGPLAGAVLHLMQAMAALSEGVAAAGAAPAALVQGVCDSTSGLCTSAGANLSSPMLAAAIRVWGALAPLTPSPGKPSPLKKAAATITKESPPLQACVEALRSFARPMGADVLSALKGNLKRLWRFPLAPADAASAGQLAAWDMQAQARQRLLLHTAVAGCKVPHEDMGAQFCLSFARTAGEAAALDFAVLLFLAQACGPAAAAGKKKAKQKRKNTKKDLDAELLPAQEVAAADGALGMLASVHGSTRYHCFGKLMMTLCAHAFELHRNQLGDSGMLSWRLALLPEAFQEGMDAEHALAILDMGFVVAGRFISEYGLPEDLDQDSIRTAVYDSVTGSADEDDDSSPALALCNAIWAACAADFFLKDLAESIDAKKVENCRKHCQQVRSLLLRSLAVNHPLTFFHAVCLALQVPGRCPQLMAGDRLANAELLSAVAACLLAEAGDALKKRLEYHATEEDEEASAEVPEQCGDLFAAVMEHISERFLSSEGSSLSHDSRIMCWRFMDALCLFSGRAVPKPVLRFCLPLAARCLAARVGGEGPYSVREAVESCLCLQTAVQQLGRGLLEKLNDIVPPLFDLVSAAPAEGAMEEDTDDAVLLEQRALKTLLELVKSVGPFLSPFLQRYLQVTSAVSPAWKTPLLEELGKGLVASVPHRVLWPAVQAAVKAARPGLEATDALDTGLLRMQRLAVLHVWVFSALAPETVAEDAEGMAASLLGLLATGTQAVGAFLRAGGQPQDVPEKVLRRELRGGADALASELPWTQRCSESSAASLHGLAAAAFAQFAMRLDIDDVRTHFTQALEWARKGQVEALALQSTKKADDGDAVGDGESASRMLAFLALMRRLAREAPGIAVELLLPLTTKDLASCLGASRRCALQLGGGLRPAARKRRKAAGGVAVRGDGAVLQGHTFWWFEVSTATLGFAGEALASETSAQSAKAVEEAVDALTEPCADQLDIFKFLPPVEESPVTQSLAQAVQGAAVALAAASDSGRVKKVLTSVLAKSRSDSVEIRLAAVRCCHKVWQELGVQVVSGLSEVVMYASELLEDEDSSVEEAVRAMIKTIEECTGESLQDALKH